MTKFDQGNTSVGGVWMKTTATFFSIQFSGSMKCWLLPTDQRIFEFLGHYWAEIQNTNFRKLLLWFNWKLEL